MASKQMKNLPNVLRNPVLMGLITEWMRDHLETDRKKAAEEGRTQRFRRTDNLIKSAIAEIERNADAKLGDHLDGV